VRVTEVLNSIWTLLNDALLFDNIMDYNSAEYELNRGVVLPWHPVLKYKVCRNWLDFILLIIILSSHIIYHFLSTKGAYRPKSPLIHRF
jgi:hypothetical protein